MNNEILMNRIDINEKKEYKLFTQKEVDKKLKSLTIYFDKEKKSRQIVRPNSTFDGEWHKLVLGLTGGHYESYEIN